MENTALTYLCPDCLAYLRYDGKESKWVCDYCDGESCSCSGDDDGDVYHLDSLWKAGRFDDAQWFPGGSGSDYSGL